MYDGASWTDVIGQQGSDYLGTSYTITDGVTPGQTYQLRVRAVNKWGQGDFSDELEAVASGEPDQIY